MPCDPLRVRCRHVPRLRGTAVYDGLGQPVISIDGNGHSTYTSYDVAGHKVEQSTPYGWETTAPTQSRLSQDPASRRPVAYLTTVMQVDADGNAVKTCTPRDFDPSEGALATGTAYPQTSAALSTLTTACASHAPLYGSISHYDPSGHVTDATRYRVTSSTADSVSAPTGSALTTNFNYDADGNTVAVSKPAAVAHTASLDPDGLPDVTVYDILDRKIETDVLRSDANSHPVYATTKNNYDDAGDTVAVQAPDADAADSATTDLHRIIDYVYDLDHRTTQLIHDATSTDSLQTLGADATNQKDLRTAYVYDADGHTIETIDPRGFTNAASVTAGGRSASDPTALNYTSVDADYMTAVVYDRNNQAIKLYAPRTNSAKGLPTDAVQAQQCPTGRQPSASDANYQTYSSTTGVCLTSYSYDQAGNRTSVTLPTDVGGAHPRAITYGYTFDNLTKTVTTPNPADDNDATTVAATVTIYDGLNNQVSVTNADGIETDTSYTDNGVVKDSKNAAASPRHEQQTIYNANGDTIAAASYVSSAQFTTGVTGAWQTNVTTDNSDGTKASSADGTGESGVIAAPHVTTYKNYDPNGNVQTVTSPNGNDTTNTYTSDGLLLTTKKPITASSTRTTTYTYDLAGRKESQDTTRTTSGTTTPANPEAFKYYANDLPTTEVGRPTPGGADLSNATGSTGTISFGYDAAGNRATINNSTPYGTPPTAGYGSQVQASYYLDSRLAQVQEGPPSGSTWPYTEQLTYNGSGSVSTRTTTTGSASNYITFTYDNAGLPVAANSNQATGTSNCGSTTTAHPNAGWTWCYQPSGLVDDASYPDGEYLNYFYNTDDTLSELKLKKTPTALTALADYQYLYDGLNRVTQQTRSGSTATNANENATFGYLYSVSGRVCQFTDVQSGGAQRIRAVQYDADGNRTAYGDGTGSSKATDCPGASSPSTATADPSWTWSRYTPNLDDAIGSDSIAKASGSTSHTYNTDADGRLTFDGSNFYCYDGLDHTLAVRALTTPVATSSDNPCSPTTPTKQTVNYGYDGLDRQTLSITVAAQTKTDTIGYDGLRSDALTETQPSAIDYLRGADGSPLAVANNTTSGGAISQDLTDDGNNNTATATSGASLLCVERFDPFGTPDTAASAGPDCSGTNTPVSSLGYQQNRADHGTGNYQDGARTYIPALSSFTTPDKYGPTSDQRDLGVATDPLTLNTYGYVNGDPVNYADPDGHAACAFSQDDFSTPKQWRDACQRTAKAQTRFVQNAATAALPSDLKTTANDLRDLERQLEESGASKEELEKLADLLGDLSDLVKGGIESQEKIDEELRAFVGTVSKSQRSRIGSLVDKLSSDSSGLAGDAALSRAATALTAVGAFATGLSFLAKIEQGESVKKALTDTGIAVIGGRIGGAVALAACEAGSEGLASPVCPLVSALGSIVGAAVAKPLVDAFSQGAAAAAAWNERDPIPFVAHPNPVFPFGL
jgi:RHS repeat-associated protein